MSTTMSFAWVSEMTVSLSLSDATSRGAEASWMGGTAAACEMEIVLCRCPSGERVRECGTADRADGGAEFSCAGRVDGGAGRVRGGGG